MSEAPSDPQNEAQTPPPRPRASLRGRGWQILRGEAPPEAYQMAALPQGADAPPNHVTDQIALDWVAAPESAKLQASPAPAGAEMLSASEIEPPLLEDEPAPEEWDSDTTLRLEALPGIETLTPSPRIDPHAYVPHAAVQELIPSEPEELPALAAAEGAEDEPTLRVMPAPPEAAPEDAGIVIRPQDARIDAARLIPPGSEPLPDGFSPDLDRMTPPDPELLTRLVTDDKLERLWGDIELLQSELSERVQGNQARLDVYQRNLLQASTLLLNDRAHYDDVRAMLYRIRVQLAHDDQVRQSIRRYKPQILIYLALAALLWLILMALEPLFSRFAADVLGLSAIGFLYHATLFGMLGAILSAYFALNKHTVHDLDFDPTHLSWYLTSPLIGLAMGLLTALLFGAIALSIVGGEAMQRAGGLSAYPFLLWIACFLAGFNQDTLMSMFRRLFSLLRGRTDAEDEIEAG